MDFFVTAVLPAALFLVMFSLGLTLVVGDFGRILTHPKAFAVGLFSQMVLLPALAYAVAIAFGLAPELALGLVILGLCPGGATGNLYTRLGLGDIALSISITSVSTLLAVVTLPLFATLMARHFLGLDVGDINVTGLSLSMLALTALPVLVAMAIRHYRPGAAKALERIAAPVAIILVVIVVIAVIGKNWTMFVEHMPVLGPSVLTLNVLVLAAGPLLATLFGLSQPQGTAIALETGLKNAALGVAAGALILDRGADISPISVPAGLYGITMYAVCAVFTVWRRRQAQAAVQARPAGLGPP